MSTDPSTAPNFLYVLGWIHVTTEEGLFRLATALPSPANPVFSPLGRFHRMLTTPSTSSWVRAWPSWARRVMLLW